MAELWAELERHRRPPARRRQAWRPAGRPACGAELERVVAARLAERVGRIAEGARYEALGDEVVARRLDPWSAADRLLAEAIDR